jgi:hypothetical protein
LPNLLIGHVDGDNLPAEDWNDNFEAIEDALFDLGPYIISGLVPSAGTGLAVDVTAGVASIGGRVTFIAFSIGGLTPSTVNHVWVLQNGTATSNTTGTAPALSAKLGTATTDATTVIAVDVSPTSGRQEKLTPGSATAWTAAQTITLNDATATVSRPLTLRHSNSGGVGAAGIGVGIDLHIETATEGIFNTAARIDARATAVTAGAVTGAIDLLVPSAGSMVTPLSVAPGQVLLAQAPTATANYGLLSAGSGGFAGGGSNFAGDADGTIYAANSVLGFTGNLIDLQQAGVCRFRVHANGDAYMGRIPGVEPNFGTLNLGHGPFDGAGAGFFTGSSAGQILAINSTIGFGGRLASFQTAGVSVLNVLGDGRVGIGPGATLNAKLYVSRPAVAVNPSNPTYFRVQGVADTAMTASTEVVDVELQLNRTLQFATGALADQRAVKILAPTYSFVGASTLTNAATLYIDNAPVAGANATITNRLALWVDAGRVRLDGDGTHVLELPADATDPTAGGGAAVGRIPVLIGGVLRFLAYY